MVPNRAKLTFSKTKDVSSTCFKQTIKTLLLTLPVLCILKTCNKKNLNFYFDTLRWLKRFYAFKAFKAFIKPFEAPQKSVKIKF